MRNIPYYSSNDHRKSGLSEVANIMGERTIRNALYDSDEAPHIRPAGRWLRGRLTPDKRTLIGGRELLN
jgi:hypothetical protein